MATSVYVVQAWHYEQYLVVEEEEVANSVEVEILDEDDCACVLVASRDSLRKAESAAKAYVKACKTVEDAEDPMGKPIASVNIFKVPTGGDPRPGELVKTVVDNTVGG